MPKNRNLGLVALGAIALAALLTVIGHLEVNDDLNPWSLTVSDFAVSDRGGVIDVAMVALAVAAAVLVPALRRVRRSMGELPLAAAAGGLLLAAVVPTNEPGLPMDAAAYLHRYASVVTFVALPVGGWLLARRDALPGTAPWLRALVLVSLALAGAMIWSAYPGDRLLIGLAERLLILVEVGLLAVVATALVRRGGRGPGDAGPADRPGEPGLTPARGA